MAIQFLVLACCWEVRADPLNRLEFLVICLGLRMAVEREDEILEKLKVCSLARKSLETSMVPDWERL